MRFKDFFKETLRSLGGLPPKVNVVPSISIIKYLKQLNYKGEPYGKQKVLYSRSTASSLEHSSE